MRLYIKEAFANKKVNAMSINKKELNELIESEHQNVGRITPLYGIFKKKVSLPNVNHSFITSDSTASLTKCKSNHSFYWNNNSIQKQRSSSIRKTYK